MATKRQVNALVTTSHVFIAVAYSFTQGLTYNTPVLRGINAKVQTALIFFAGLLDIFLSVVLWLILDFDKSPSVLIDTNKVYAVLDVAKAEQPVLI